MATRLISNGTDKTYFHQCPKCSSIFEYEYQDIDCEKISDSMYIHRTECPGCNEKVIVNLDTVEEFMAHSGTSFSNYANPALLAAMTNQCCCKKEGDYSA